MTRWLVTGTGGALGRDLLDVLTGAASDADVVGLDHQALDVASAEAVTAALDSHQPTVVINAAAYTKVDDAEAHEDDATLVNGVGPGLLAAWCAAHGARLIHVSTDYVFPGEGSAPYEVDAAVGPVSAYGRSKLAGEHAVLAAGGDGHVVRTGWLYGANGPSFVRAVGRKLLGGETVDVVTDQRGAPTWTRELASRLVALGTAGVEPGIWHCSAAGEATWFDVAVALADLLGVPTERVRPTTSAAMARPAPRPAYSVLSNAKWNAAGLPAMAPWRDALADALAREAQALTA
ncbi:MAG TPA: dTDP-4-dehydrorhamnose reductase [Mycobacteriales bacterium]|nr:dTDP-4-dehydrorhamnose reductase [Mycobacteriales bacterium]